MKFEDSYLYTALELVNRALAEDDNGIFDAAAACEAAARQVSNLGIVQKLWDERGAKVLLTAWGQNRHYFVPPAKMEEEEVPEAEGERLDPDAQTEDETPSRRFGAAKRTIVWPRPFNTLVVVHREGETGLEVRFGDITRELAQSAYNYRTNQLAGRRENLDAGYGTLLARLPYEGTTRVYDLLKGNTAAASDILAHIEKVER